MKEKKENAPMAFGKKYKVLNFSVLKYTRTLSRDELKELRSVAPAIDVKGLQRMGMPYIKVSAISGIWAVEYCSNTEMYRMIEATVSSGTEKDVNALASLFNMMFMDTSVIGDEEYFAAKMTAMGDYLKRRRAGDIDKEADDAVLEDVKADFELKENLETMSELEKKIEEGGES